MKLIYTDESGNTGLNLKDKEQPIFLLACLIIDENQWFDLEEDFQLLMENYLKLSNNTNFEIHAIDLKIGRGVFQDLDFKQRLALRNDFFELIKKYQLPIFYRRIIKKNFEEFCIQNYGSGIQIQPYIMALPFIFSEVESYLSKNNSYGMFIFDEQKEYYLDVERSIKLLRLDKTSLLKTSKIIEKGFFVDSKKSFGIQLIDILAYYIRKYEENKLNIKISEYDKEVFPIIESLNLINENTNIKDVFDWIKQNYIK